MKKRLVLLDSLRAVMPLLVMIFHMSWAYYDQFQVSFFNMHKFEKTGGVDLFWVLSGFLIYYLYANKAGEDGAAGNFFGKRLLRIMPFFFFVNMITFAFNEFSTMNDFKHLAGALLFIPGYEIIGPAWSLNYTMLFYLLFALYLKWPKGMTLFAIFYCVFLLTGLQWQLYEVGIDHLFLEFLFHQSGALFILGIASAAYVKKYRLQYPLLPIITGILGYATIWANYTYEFFPFEVTQYYGMFAALVLIGCANIDLKRDLKLPRIVTLAANASFAVFLIHEQLVGYSEEFVHWLGLKGYPAYFAGIVFIFLIAVGCHFLIEKPLNRLIKFIVDKISSWEIPIIRVARQATIYGVVTAIVISMGVLYSEQHNFWKEEFDYTFETFLKEESIRVDLSDEQLEEARGIFNEALELMEIGEHEAAEELWERLWSLDIFAHEEFTFEMFLDEVSVRETTSDEELDHAREIFNNAMAYEYKGEYEKAEKHWEMLWSLGIFEED